MVDIFREYLICNRVFEKVNKLNLLLETIYVILEVKKKILWFEIGKKAPKIKGKSKYRLVIRAVAYSKYFGEFVIEVYDEKQKKRKFRERLYVTSPIPKMERVRNNVILFTKY